MKRRALIVAAVAALFVLGASHQTTFAQLASNEVYVDQSFQFAMDHDGLNATSYRLYRDNVVVEAVSKTAAWVSGVVTFPARAETVAGTYAYHATAINSDGTTTLESPASATLSVVVKPALVTPNAPTLPRIIRLPSD